MGSYRTFGPLPAPSLTPGVFATADDDCANRLLFGLWAGGALDF